MTLTLSLRLNLRLDVEGHEIKVLQASRLLTLTLIKNKGRPSWDFVMPPPEGLKTAKFFQCAQPLQGAPRVENGKHITPFSTNTFKPREKKLNKTLFFLFLGVPKVFWPETSLVFSAHGP